MAGRGDGLEVLRITTEFGDLYAGGGGRSRHERRDARLRARQPAGDYRTAENAAALLQVYVLCPHQ